MKKQFLPVLLMFLLVLVLSCSKGDTGPSGPTGKTGENVAVLEFQNGVYPSDVYAGTTDAYIESGTPADTNYGSSTSLFIGHYLNFLTDHNDAERFVLKFDLTGFQGQNIKVKKAEITLYTVQCSPTETTMTVTPLELTNSWVETETTWNSRNATEPWALAGGDYLPSPAAGDSVKLEKINEYKIFNINPSIVQKWIDTPENNFGLIFISDTEKIIANRYFGFYSGNYASNLLKRPKLTIYYTLQ